MALGITVAELDEEPPTPTSSPFIATPSMHSYSPYQTGDEHARLEKWLTINTTIYYHVAPSLNLSGLYREQEE